MAINAVIFDIGNVLIEWQPERYYDAVIGPERRKAMFAAVDLHAMNDEIDRGGDFRQVVYDTADSHPEHREAIRMWHDNWHELARPDIPETARLLRALRATGVPVFLLSNIGEGTYEIAAKAYPVLRDCDRRYLSGQMGVIKPDPLIYEMVEQDCGLPPETLLFTDDRQDNIDAARSRGWQAHLFEGPEGFARCLADFGLIPKGAA